MESLFRFSIALLLFFTAFCSRFESRIQDAFSDMGQGKFDSSFAKFEEFHQKHPRDSRILSGLGLLLTLKRISLFAGIDLMREAIEMNLDEVFPENIIPEQFVLEELLLLRIAMGNYKGAEKLIRSKFTQASPSLQQRLARTRLALSCMENPSTSQLKVISANFQNDSYTFLCKLALLKKKGYNFQELTELYKSFGRRKTQCRVITLWSDTSNASLLFLPEPFLSCQRYYSGWVSLYRPFPLLQGKEKTDIVNPKLLFDMDRFSPEEPGARGRPNRRITEWEESKEW